MASEIGTGEIDAHSKDLNANNYAGGFLSEVVFHAPSAGVQDVEAAGPENDAKQSCQGRFGEVEAVADEVREKCIED